MDALALAFFGLWGLLATVWQISPIRDHLDRFPALREFRLLPVYTFFAPNPGIADYHLLVRAAEDDGSVSEWTEVAIGRPRSAFDLFWHPTKRRQKLVADALSGIKQVRNDALAMDADEDDVALRVRLSQPYLVLLNFAMSAPSFPPDRPRQFLVAEGVWERGERDLVPLFRSPFHACS